MNAFKDLIRAEIRALTAYHVQPARGMIKLDQMENPYGLAPDLKAEIGSLAADSAINRYPDPTASELKARLREAMPLPDEAGLMLGNGSDELIQIIALAVAKPGAILLAPEPSFVMFRLIASFCGLKYVGVDLHDDFSLDRRAMLQGLREHKPAVTFLAYPNNPTGNLFDADSVRSIIKASPGLVVVDEAYFAFSQASLWPELLRYPNLLVMRTVSKLGLAGLRLGLLAGPTELIEELDKLRLPYNINVLTQRVAARVLADFPALQSQAAQICADRTLVFDALNKIPGVTPYASQANFILFRVAAAERVFDGLKQHGILLKNLTAAHPLLNNCLRVTIGTPTENEIFLKALRDLLTHST
ncbi:MAG: histidinol-phosphate transaminase [Burkholderiales bacterium]|nr:histidinol-phosphate transaminase [Burkholderiales bacterium]